MNAKTKAKTAASKTKAKAAAPAKSKTPAAALKTLTAISKAAAAPVTPPAAAKTKAAKPDTAPAMGRAAALKEAGDLTGPFEPTAAARAAGAPAALGLREDSARWNIMAYAFKHPKDKIARSDLERIAGAQLGQALSGLVRYRFLARA